MKRLLLIMSLCALTCASFQAIASEPYAPKTKLRPTKTLLL